MIKNILKSDFNKNVLTLLTGTTIAQALPVAISPILTRLYTPEDFAALALFIAITSILGSIANGRYELAIVLPNKDEDAINITALAIIVAMSFSMILFILILIFKTKIKVLFSLEIHCGFLLLIPLVVLITGVYNALNYCNTRLKKYKNIANVNILRSVTLSISQMVFGIFKLGSAGLVGGQIISSFTAVTKLGNIVWQDKKLISNINKRDIIKVAKEYDRFPKYSIGGIFVNTFSQNINVLIIPILFNSASLGYFSLVNRMLGMPTSLIGNSISQVYFQRASVENNEKGSFEKLFKTTLLKLILISVPLFMILYIIVDNFIIFIFGEEWIMLKEISKILIPLFFIRFISSTLSTTLTVYQREKEFLLINVVILILVTTAILLSIVNNYTIEGYLLIQTVLLSVLYVSLIFRYHYISKGKKNEGLG